MRAIAAFLVAAPNESSEAPSIVSVVESDDHSGLVAGLEMFTFPAGLNTCRGYFVFILTGDDGSRTYGHVLRFGVDGDDEIHREKEEALCILSTERACCLWQQILEMGVAKRRESVHSLDAFMWDVVFSLTTSSKNDFISVGIEAEAITLPIPTTAFPCEDLDLQPLFDRLSSSNILTLLFALLSESRIIIVSSHPPSLSASLLAISSLIAPFSWRHVLVVSLPPPLMACVTAPFPFLVGMDAAHLPLLDSFDVEEIIVVLLDENRIVQRPASSKAKPAPPLSSLLPPQFPSPPPLLLSLLEQIRTIDDEKINAKAVADIFVAFFLSCFRSVVNHHPIPENNEAMIELLPHAVKKLFSKFKSSQLFEALRKEIVFLRENLQPPISKLQLFFMLELHRLMWKDKATNSHRLPLHDECFAFPRAQKIRALTALFLRSYRQQANDNNNKIEDRADVVGGVRNQSKHQQYFHKFQNGDTYSGGWLNGLPNGEGIFISQSKKALTEDKSEEEEEEMEGNGAIFSPSYEGNWKGGMRFGRGIEKTLSAIISADWKWNRPQGRVLISYSNGSKYRGGMVNWKREGSGEFVEKNNVERKYDGEWKNDRPHGRGEITVNGETVQGVWKDGVFQHRLSGSDNIHQDGVSSNAELRQERCLDALDKAGTYDGEWGDKRRNGKGRWSSRNGQISFDGEWKEGKPHGAGELKLSIPRGVWEELICARDSCNCYEAVEGILCEFTSRILEGEGEGKDCDSCLQEGGVVRVSHAGEWKNGMANGDGVENIEIPSDYCCEEEEEKGQSRCFEIVGMWNDGQLSGANAQICDDVLSFDIAGEECCAWKTGEMTVSDIATGRIIFRGSGCLVEEPQQTERKVGILDDDVEEEDGGRRKIYYEGEWRNGLKDGRGVMLTQHDGSMFDGQWKNGVAGSGLGKLEFRDGSRFEGEWNDDGFLHGLGEACYADGRKYRGEWRDGRREGDGWEKTEDGSEYRGFWKNGLRDGKGTLKTITSEVFDGVWKEGRWVEGTATIPSFGSFSGRWKASGGARSGRQTTAIGDFVPSNEKMQRLSISSLESSSASPPPPPPPRSRSNSPARRER